MPAENLAELREDALAMLRSNNALLEASRNEPSGGPGWREGLGMLAQFGRTIFDALVALGIRRPRKPRRPLCATTRSPNSAGSSQIFNQAFNIWQNAFTAGAFHIPPPNLNLEEDIAHLEERMAKVRHTGSTFRRQRSCAPTPFSFTSSRLPACCAPRALKPAVQSAKRNSTKASQETCATLPRNPRSPSIVDRIAEAQMPFALRSEHRSRNRRDMRLLKQNLRSRAAVLVNLLHIRETHRTHRLAARTSIQLRSARFTSRSRRFRYSSRCAAISDSPAF